MYHPQYAGAMPGQYMPMPGQMVRQYAPPPPYEQVSEVKSNIDPVLSWRTRKMRSRRDLAERF